MKIAWVSTWPPRHCGIATYSLDLVGALRKLGHEVIVICHSDGGQPGEKQVEPLLNPDDPNWDEVLYQKIVELSPDVVHIQHEYALYNRNNDYSSGLLRLLLRLKVERRVPVVLTYHSVYTTLHISEKTFMDAALRLSSGIVHEGYQWANLPLNLGWVPENVHVIPHGAKEVKKYPRSFRNLTFEDTKVIGLLGWWEPNKGFERVIRLWADIYEKTNQAYRLLVAGDARPGSTSGPEAKEKILAAIESCPVKDSIDCIIGSFSPEEYDNILSCVDIMVLPYSHASQSGNLAHSFALGIPAVVSNLEGLKSQVEESRAGISFDRENDHDLVRAVSALAGDDALRNELSHNASTYVTEEIKWSIVAQKHTRMYEKMRTDFFSETEKRSLDGKIHL